MNPVIDTTRELGITRVLHAPVTLVQQMWSDPENITHWWGPVGFSTTTHDMDFRSGGSWTYTMHGPDGTDYPNYIRYREVSSGRLDYEHGTSPDDIHFDVVVTFTEVDGNKTELDMRLKFPTAEALRKVAENTTAKNGMFETVTRLDMLLGDRQAEEDPFHMHISLPSDLEIRSVRSFRAPRELVFEACTNANHIQNWQGPKRFTFTECSYDARVGGKWSMAHVDTDGNKYEFHGDILEFERPEKVVATFAFLDFDPMVNHTTFEESNGITRLTTISKFTSKENRDGMLYSGMEEGMNEGYARLDVLLASGLKV